MIRIWVLPGRLRDTAVFKLTVREKHSERARVDELACTENLEGSAAPETITRVGVFASAPTEPARRVLVAQEPLDCERALRGG